MNITEYLKENQEKFISLFGFIMVFVLGFFSGYYYLLDKIDNEEIKVIEPCTDCSELFKKDSQADSLQGKAEDSTLAKEEAGVKLYVASKNSKVFHKPDCSFVAKIKEENKIWFSSIKEAESKGFKPHSCVDGQ